MRKSVRQREPKGGAGEDAGAGSILADSAARALTPPAPSWVTYTLALHPHPVLPALLGRPVFPRAWRKQASLPL